VYESWGKAVLGSYLTLLVSCGLWYILTLVPSLPKACTPMISRSEVQPTAQKCQQLTQVGRGPMPLDSRLGGMISHALAPSQGDSFCKERTWQIFHENKTKLLSTPPRHWRTSVKQSWLFPTSSLPFRGCKTTKNEWNLSDASAWDEYEELSSFPCSSTELLHWRNQGLFVQ
jgi:hypothetical protein